MDSHLDPFRPLDPDRQLVTQFWASLIVIANERAVHAPVLDKQRRYVLDRATWAVTEITPAASTKYMRQRYWSCGALAWAKQPSASASSAGAALRHEHVIERRELIEALAKVTDPAQVEALLDRAVACVVTREEAVILNRAAGSGWSRYRSASVEVFDRQLRKLHSSE